MVNTILAVLLLGFLAVFGSIGFGIAHVAHQNPPWDSRIKVAIGLFFLALGLFRQFRLGTFGPKSHSVNRVQESLSNTAIILLGAVQLITDNFARVPVGVVALVLFTVALLRRPRRLFANPK